MSSQEEERATTPSPPSQASPKLSKRVAEIGEAAQRNKELERLKGLSSSSKDEGLALESPKSWWPEWLKERHARTKVAERGGKKTRKHHKKSKKTKKVLRRRKLHR